MTEVHTSDQKQSTFLEKSRYQISTWIIVCNAEGSVREDEFKSLKNSVPRAP
jgi:hypothetical protein